MSFTSKSAEKHGLTPADGESCSKNEQRSPASPYRLRVIGERDDLLGKINLLAAFLKTPQFRKLSEDERFAIQVQDRSMMQYLNALNRRISLWGLE